MALTSFPFRPPDNIFGSFVENLNDMKSKLISSIPPVDIGSIPLPFILSKKSSTIDSFKAANEALDKMVNKMSKELETQWDSILKDAVDNGMGIGHISYSDPNVGIGGGGGGSVVHIPVGRGGASGGGGGSMGMLQAQQLAYANAEATHQGWNEPDQVIDRRAMSMLVSRMAGINDKPFLKPGDFLYCHVYADNVYVFYLFSGKDGSTKEDAAIFPSDKLITQLRMII